MKKETYTDFSTDELLKRKKTTRFALGLIIGALAMLIILTVYEYSQNKKYLTFAILALSQIPLFFVNFYQLKLINKELESRNI